MFKNTLAHLAKIITIEDDISMKNPVFLFKLLFNRIHNFLKNCNIVKFQLNVLKLKVKTKNS